MEQVEEAAGEGRLDDINPCVVGLHSPDVLGALQAFNPTEIDSLGIAIEKGQTEVVRVLVEKRKVAVTERTPFGVPLLRTGKNCPLEITKILVENGADVNQVGKHPKATALTRACGFKRLDVVQYLVEKGASINQVVNGTTALAIASKRKSFDIVRYLAGKGADMNQVVSGGTALHNACRDGFLDAVRCLVECGADVNLAAGVHQETPLHGACWAKSLDMARCLVEHGANVNATDSEGCPPLAVCCKNGTFRTARFLLENGADPNLPDHYGRTSLLHAAMNQQRQCVACLFDMGNISQQDKIDGLELLGASLIIQSKNFKRGHQYLCRGMRERYRDPLHAVEKVPLSPVPAYGDFMESQTLVELEQRRESTHLTKEALLIWERVLGRGAKEVKQIFSRHPELRWHVPAAWFLHALRTSRSLPTMEEIQSLTSIVKCRKPLAFSFLEETLTLFFEALSSHKNNGRRYGTFHPHFVSAQGILIFQVALSVAQTKEEMKRLEGLLRNFLQPTMTGPRVFLALHVALKNIDLSPDFINLLLGCKADLIDTQDDGGNTPLHLLFSRQLYKAELPAAQTVARMLLKAGAHLDARNKKFQTPLQCQYSDQFQEILKDYTCTPPSLQCCCARVIVSEKIPFHSLPEKMKKFIKLH